MKHNENKLFTKIQEYACAKLVEKAQSCKNY